MISKQTEQLANKMGELLIHVYSDCKKLTLSAFYLPRRIVTSYLSHRFVCNSQTIAVQEMKSLDFQYITPVSHSEFMECVVENNG